MFIEESEVKQSKTIATADLDVKVNVPSISVVCASHSPQDYKVCSFT